VAGVAEGWAKVPLDALGGRGLIRLMVAPLTVQLGARAYPIHFGERLAPGLRAEVAQLTAAGRRVAVVTDEAVRAAQGAFLAEVFGTAPVLALPPGEGAKSLSGLERVLEPVPERSIAELHRLGYQMAARLARCRR
jgi:hypothetical protein